MDIRQLQQLDQFVAFFELITNPEKYQKLVAEAKQASDDFTKFVKEERGIKDVDQYKAKVLEAQAKKDAEIEAKREELNKRIVEFNEFMEETRAKHKEKEDALSKARKALEERAFELDKHAEFLATLQAEKDDLDVAKAEVEAIKAAVKKREEQLAAVLKGE